MAKKDDGKQWRSACPVSRILEILGDKWSLLIIRDLMVGRTRFKEFMTSGEGIPSNILTDRLRRLIQYELIQSCPVVEGGKRLQYLLTPKGEALRPALLEMVSWAIQFEQGTEIAEASFSYLSELERERLLGN